jgi:hypothetical protein
LILRKVGFRADQKDARHMRRPDGCSAREEWQAYAVQQAPVTPVLRMKVLFLSSQLPFLTYTLHVEKVRVYLQKKNDVWDTKIVKMIYLNECLNVSLPSSVLQLENKVLK